MKILPSGRMHRAIMIISLLLVTTGASWVAGMPSRSASASNREPARLAGTDPYLELSVTPSMATPGTLVTLHITCHYIGSPYTCITVDPSGCIAYEPEISMPCKYNEHPNGCTAITFRTLATGVVTFHAGADGEIFDWGCHCFHWGVATDNGPPSCILSTISGRYSCLSSRTSPRRNDRQVVNAAGAPELWTKDRTNM